MAARAIWKGVVSFGSVRLPIKLYSGVQERAVHFRMLATKRHEPVEQHVINPRSEQTVDYADIQRGFQVEEGFVLLKKAELDKLEPKPSREISVSAFVSPMKLGPEWFVRPYVLSPEGNADEYFALHAALREAGKEGLAHWVMRNVEYHGVLRPEGDYLALITLRHCEELRSVAGLKAPEGRGLNEKEKKLAEQLIASYTGEFDPGKLHDDYRERLLALVNAKARGKSPRLHAPVEKVTQGNLEAALNRSLKQAQKRRPSPTARRGHKVEARPRAREPRKEKRVA